MSAILVNAGANKVVKTIPPEALKKIAEMQKVTKTGGASRKFAETSKKPTEVPKHFPEVQKKLSNTLIESSKSSEQSEINLALDVPQEEPKDDEKSREKRRATGRSVAIVIFLSFMCLALYHVVQSKTTVLAGVLVPALIIFTYLFFVIHVSSRDKKKMKDLEANDDLELSVPSDFRKQELHKKISTVSNPSSISSATIPSTSGTSLILMRNMAKNSTTNSTVQVKLDPKTMKLIIDPKGNQTKKIPPPFKKAQSQSHIQVKSNQSTHIAIEHESKKLKKSRSFDKNNLVEPRHMIDNKKIKTKH